MTCFLYFILFILERERRGEGRKEGGRRGRERERRGEKRKHQLVLPLVEAFIG